MKAEGEEGNMTNANGIKKVALYFRVSSDQQVQGDTIKNQYRVLPEYAKSQGWEILATFEDKGKSGTSLEGRPQFKNMLERIEDGEFDAVVVRHSDRLTRTDDLAEWGLIMGAFQKSGTRIASPYEGVTDLAHLTGQVMEFVRGRMSSEENKKRNERVRETKKKRLDQGIYSQSGSVCYGYEVQSGGKRGEPPKVVQKNAEALVLKEVHRLMVTEGWSATQVCVHFNEQGIKTRRGRDWRPSTLTHIIRNTALFGQMIANRWIWEKRQGKNVLIGERRKEEWKTIKIPKPIFIKEEWLKLNGRLNANRSKGRPAMLEGKYLCRGFLKCDLCGSTYTTFNGGSGPDHKKYYYACSNRRVPKKLLINGAMQCKSSPLIRQELMDEVVWNEITNILLWPEKVLDEWFRRSEPTFSEIEARELKEIQAQIEGYRAKIRRIYDLVSDSGMELDYGKGKIMHYKALINTLNEKTDKIKERATVAQAQKTKLDYIRSGLKRFEATLEKKLGPNVHPLKHCARKTRPKRKLMAKALHALDFNAKRNLIKAVVGAEFIRVCPSPEARKVKPDWSPRPINASFELWFQGILNVDRVINQLESIDKKAYLKALNTSRYRQCCS
jgi:site-specific DNA recombinase